MEEEWNMIKEEGVRHKLENKMKCWKTLSAFMFEICVISVPTMEYPICQLLN